MCSDCSINWLLPHLFWASLFPETQFWNQEKTDYAAALGCVDHNKLWKILQEMGILDHLICLLENLYAGQEATIRTGQFNS